MPEGTHREHEAGLGQRESLVLCRRPTAWNRDTTQRTLTCADRSKVALVWSPLTLLPWPLLVIANVPVYFCSWGLLDIRRGFAGQVAALTTDLSDH